MGPFLEMKTHHTTAALLVLVALLAGCGNDQKPSSLPIKAIVQAQIAKLKGGGQAAPTGPVAEPDGATLAEGRRVLQEGGQPVIAVTDRGLGLATFMVPLGSNSGVITWANPEYQTIAMRDGVILATRGFGADLMSAEAPTTERLFTGTGAHRRVYYVLDGADQTQKLMFDCQLSVSKNETIQVLGLGYETKKVEEACVGGRGNLTNTYWFDENGTIRQSRQARIPGAENMQLQAIID